MGFNTSAGNLPAYSESGQGEPLILIMGLGAAGERWTPHVEAWSHRYRCIMIDNRGTGGSLLGDEELSIRLLADDVLRVIDHLGLTSVRLAGISMGSTIAQQILLDRPGLVHKAALIATWSSLTPSLGLFFETLERAARRGDARLLRLLLHQFIWTPEWTDAHAAEVERILSDPAGMPFETIARQAVACRRVELSDRLAEIVTPTLVTYGARDLAIQPSASRLTASLIPGAEVVGFATGHVHHWEELETFNRTVGEWLA